MMTASVVMFHLTQSIGHGPQPISSVVSVNIPWHRAARRKLDISFIPSRVRILKIPAGQAVGGELVDTVRVHVRQKTWLCSIRLKSPKPYVISLGLRRTYIGYDSRL